MRAPTPVWSEVIAHTRGRQITFRFSLFMFMCVIVDPLAVITLARLYVEAKIRIWWRTIEQTLVHSAACTAGSPLKKLVLTSRSLAQKAMLQLLTFPCTNGPCRLWFLQDPCVLLRSCTKYFHHQQWGLVARTANRAFATPLAMHLGGLLPSGESRIGGVVTPGSNQALSRRL